MLYGTAHGGMDIVLSIIFFILGILSFSVACILGRNRVLKKKSGKIIIGKKISCDELLGRPTRYIVKVEYEVNNTIYKKNVITADKNIKKCVNDEPIRLLYVDKINKVYWPEDKSDDMFIGIALSGIFAVNMFLLSFVFLSVEVPLFNKLNEKFERASESAREFNENLRAKDEYTAILLDNKEDFDYVAELVGQSSFKDFSGYLNFYLSNTEEIKIDNYFATNDQNIANEILSNEEFHDHLLNLYYLEKIDQMLYYSTSEGYVVEFKFKEYYGSLYHVEGVLVPGASVIDENWVLEWSAWR